MAPDIEYDDPAWTATDELNGEPPLILADLPPEVRTIIEQLVAVLGLSGNLGIPTDNLDTEAGQLERDAMSTDAQSKFPASEESSAQMLQTIPQLASGIAGAIGGAISGALQPLAQLAQQGAQAGTQAMQTGLSALQGTDPDTGYDEPVDELTDDLGGEGDFGTGGVSGTGGLGGTTPAAQLGPPSTPSAATFPASSPNTPAPQAASASSAPGNRMPMSAMPFMPGSMQGSGPAPDTKTDTKRVVAPTVRNGAPVQGRLASPPPPEVTRHVRGKPVATRRIVAPGPDDDPPER